MWEDSQTVIVNRPFENISAGTVGRLEWHSEAQGISCVTIWECGVAHRFQLPNECLQPVVMPHQHRAGIPKDQQINLRRGALAMLETAQGALEELEPQPADFPPERFEDARGQHDRRLRTLRVLQSELSAELDLIRDCWHDEAPDESSD